jgi:hypothetical protein
VVNDVVGLKNKLCSDVILLIFFPYPPIPTPGRIR